MNKNLKLACLVVAATLWMGAKVGKKAPAFSLPDSTGQTRSLGDYKGKYVVLEWYNPDCPYVKKHYAGNMQALQKEWTAKGVVWLSVNSSAPGKQGNLSAEKAEALRKEKGSAPTAILLDPKGEVGRRYKAKTTPHMYVIDPKGALIYAGAIDDKPTTSADDIPGSRNYVRQALEESMAGKPISTPSTQAYGCSVKY
jgi:peroxiredoxin